MIFAFWIRMNQHEIKNGMAGFADVEVVVTYLHDPEVAVCGI